MMGTAKYLSPEQVRGRKLDGRADLYSLGLVLYECLAGRVPFLGETDADTAPRPAAARSDRSRPAASDAAAGPRQPDPPPARPQPRPTARPPGAELRAELQRVADEPPRRPHPGGGTPAPVRARSAATAGRPATGTGTPRPGTPPIPGDGGPPAQAPLGTPARRRRPHRNAGPRRAAGPASSSAGPSLIVVARLPLRRPDRRPRAVGHDRPRRRRRATGSDDHAGATSGAAGRRPADSAPTPSRLRPDGDGEENDDQAAAVADGDPATAWRPSATPQYMGGKPGVGLVVTPRRPATGTLGVRRRHAPYQIEVFAAAGDDASPSDRRLGCAIAERAFSSGRARSRSTSPRPGATSSSCSARSAGRELQRANPYRGTIGEIRFDVWPSAGAPSDDDQLGRRRPAGDRARSTQLLRRHYDRVHAVPADRRRAATPTTPPRRR